LSKKSWLKTKGRGIFEMEAKIEEPETRNSEAIIDKLKREADDFIGPKDVVEIEAIVGGDLSDFKVMELHEVYRTNSDGEEAESCVFLKDKKIAMGFVRAQENPGYYNERSKFVLTNGTIGFVILKKPVEVNGHEKAMQVIKEAVIEKLGPEISTLLGIS